MKTKFLITLLIYAVALTGCPSKSIQDAKATSGKIATYANAGVNLTRELYGANFLTLEQKDKIADGFIVLAKAGIVFDQAIVNAETTYGSNVPQNEIERLSAVFDAQIVTKFLDILTLLKLTNRAGNYAAVIESLRTAILIGARVFGHYRDVNTRIAAVTGG